MKYGTLLGLLIPAIVLSCLFFIPPQNAHATHPSIDLLTANSFAVLAESAVVNSNPSDITGDLGLSPTTGAAIGVPCGEVTGTIYSVDGAGPLPCRVTDAGLLTQAKTDLTTAYNDAVGRATTSTIGTALGGATLTDGTFDSADGTFSIAAGQTLTLDGEGNPDAVFIFKMATTLITGASSQIVLANDAQACNVFWQVGSSATLGTTTTFVGSILADQSITDNGGSTVAGRFLASAAAVTLDNTTITAPECTPTPTPTPTPSPTPSPIPTATPDITQVLGATSNTSSSFSASGGVDPCEAPLVTNTPIITDWLRISPTSIFISWGPYAGWETFNVRYGFEANDWPYNTNVTGFSVTINDLPPNQPIWVQVAARNNCAIGPYSDSGTYGVIGEYSAPQLLEIPKLPNTGFVPNNKSTLWYLMIISLFTYSLLLIKKVCSF